jgi:hypothetical protein
MRAFARVLAIVFSVLCAIHAGGSARADVPPPPIGTPTADDTREARRHFAVGNDLYKDGRYREALLEFDAAYGLSGRPAALLNVGDCQRQLNAYVDAYETYQAVLARHGAQLSPADKTAVQKAVDYLDGHTGLVAIASSQEGAEVLVDDRVVGRTPLATPVRLDIGIHKIIVRKDGFVPFAPPADVQILSKQLVKVDATLLPEVLTGHLSVREANGREVRILVDDADKGPAPWEGDLAPGPHVVEAKGDRFAAEQKLVVVVKGEHADLVLTAEPTTGHLRIGASPAGATIELDRRNVGAGSWEGDVAPGSHRIEAALGEVRAARDVLVIRGATVVQEIPLPITIEAPPEYAGLYARLALMFLLQVSKYPQPNSVSGDVKVDSTSNSGGGATLHLGYSFGSLSAEVAGAFLFTGANQNVQPLATMNTCDYEVHSLNGLVGPGARIASQTTSLRSTAGLAFGAAFRDYSAAICGGLIGSHAGYVAPALLLDAGFLFGRTPGVKFSVGVVGWVDFPSKDVVVGPDTSLAYPNQYFSAPGRGYLLASGPQVFFGPTLGVQFGH